MLPPEGTDGRNTRLDGWRGGGESNRRSECNNYKNSRGRGDDVMMFARSEEEEEGGGKQMRLCVMGHRIRRSMVLDRQDSGGDCVVIGKCSRGRQAAVGISWYTTVNVNNFSLTREPEHGGYELPRRLTRPLRGRLPPPRRGRRRRDGALHAAGHRGGAADHANGARRVAALPAKKME